jgi:hypothetical protein
VSGISVRLAAWFAACAAIAGAQQFFDERVEPILSKRCVPSHNDQMKNGVSFMGRDGLLKGGNRGPAIVPGKPDASLMILAVRQQGELKMPPGGKLSAEEIATLTQWVKDGAPWGEKLRAGELWTFDRTDQLGGHPTKILGNPRVIDTEVGKAVAFNGKGDALFVDVHPLAGAEVFTWEVIFKPDADGAREQRFFHLQENGSDTRMLFEIRIAEDGWYLDSFVMSSTGSRTLMNRANHHPFGAWYHVAMVYDGREFRNYVNGAQENQGEVKFAPQKAGRSSAGVRINLVDYFKGAIAVSRMTRRALTPEEFLLMPRR